MIETREDKTRIKCPVCNAFIAEVKPRLEYGQAVTARCPRCKKEVTLTNGREKIMNYELTIKRGNSYEG